MEAISLNDKLKQYFGDMLVFKSPENGKFFSNLSLPSFMRDWLVMRFSNEDGQFDKEEVTKYVKMTIPKKAQWKQLQFEMVRNYQPVRFLTKIKIELDTATRTAYFSLPDFGVPKRKGEAVADWDIVESNKEYLLAPNEVWGIVEIECEEQIGKNPQNILKLIDFVPFCPYQVDMEYFCEARNAFSTEEWIDTIISAIDYNPAGYAGMRQKLTMLSRLLPFVEQQVNLIELAPKETGKSYLFTQISKYGWLVSGGSISRAKMFYDIGKREEGLVSHYDYVAFDEVQSIKFTDANEMQGALKGYLESQNGEYRVGDHKGNGRAGLVLLGNIDVEHMNINTNMLADLPTIFHESALLDRFHGFIKGWDIPKMNESLKARGWSLNVEYFGEILHLFRSESIYRGLVDELLLVPKNAATRDTEAIKRICTAFMKLIFPNIRSVEQVDIGEFKQYCLEPAMEMRRVIKIQLGIIDSGEFGGKEIPNITVKGE